MVNVISSILETTAIFMMVIVVWVTMRQNTLLKMLLEQYVLRAQESALQEESPLKDPSNN